MHGTIEHFPILYFSTFRLIWLIINYKTLSKEKLKQISQGWRNVDFLREYLTDFRNKLSKIYLFHLQALFILLVLKMEIQMHFNI